MVRPFSFLNNHRLFQFLPWLHVLLLLFTVCFLMVNCWNPAADKKKEKAKKRKAKNEVKIKTVDMEMPVRKTKTPWMPAEPFNRTPTPTPSPYTSPYQSTQKVVYFTSILNV